MRCGDGVKITTTTTKECCRDVRVVVISRNDVEYTPRSEMMRKASLCLHEWVYKATRGLFYSNFLRSTSRTVLLKVTNDHVMWCACTKRVFLAVNVLGSEQESRLRRWGGTVPQVSLKTRVN